MGGLEEVLPKIRDIVKEEDSGKGRSFRGT